MRRPPAGSRPRGARAEGCNGRGTPASARQSGVAQTPLATSTPPLILRGVFWDGKNHRWRAQIGHNNKKVRRTDTAAARVAAAGPLALLSLPDRTAAPLFARCRASAALSSLAPRPATRGQPLRAMVATIPANKHVSPHTCSPTAPPAVPGLLPERRGGGGRVRPQSDRAARSVRCAAAPAAARCRPRRPAVGGRRPAAAGSVRSSAACRAACRLPLL